MSSLGSTGNTLVLDPRSRARSKSDHLRPFFCFVGLDLPSATRRKQTHGGNLLDTCFHGVV